MKVQEEKKKERRDDKKEGRYSRYFFGLPAPK